MSWVYWGIVLGFMALVVTLLVSVDIYYGAPDQAEDGASDHPSGGGKKAAPSTKHAA